MPIEMLGHLPLLLLVGSKGGPMYFASGDMSSRQGRVFISRILSGDRVGLLPISDDRYRVFYGPLATANLTAEIDVFSRCSLDR